MSAILFPSWDTFNYKYGTNKQDALENLARALFCEQFGIFTGIFQRINHAGNETNTITKNGEIIGFQAKYFERTINEAQIRKSIDAAHEVNPRQTKLYLYTNMMFGNPPKGNSITEKEKKLNEYAQSRSMEIEWVVGPMILDQAAKITWIRELFFEVGPNMETLVRDEQSHSGSLLASICDRIAYCGQVIKFDRNTFIKTIFDTINKHEHLVIHGEGGAGKTAVIKDFYNRYSKKFPICVRKAQELNVAGISDIFKHTSNYDLSQFIEAYSRDDKKVFIIDSAERLQDIEDDDHIKLLLQKLTEAGWSIVFTVRSVYVEDLRSDFQYTYHLECKFISLNNISEQELNECALQYRFQLPCNDRFKDRLRNLFYLDLYLRLYDADSLDETYTSFIKRAWIEKIAGRIRKNCLNTQREKCFSEIIWERVNSGRFYLRPDAYIDEVVYALKCDEVVAVEENKGLFITHDIYEEWGLSHILELEWTHRESIPLFFSKIGSSLLMRRAFRSWLSDKIDENKSDINSLVGFVFEPELESLWRDEILVSMLRSEYAETFFESHKEILLADNAKLLNRAIFLLQISCKYIAEVLSYEGTEHPILEPLGKGWNAVIDLIYENQGKHIPIAGSIKIIEDWTEYCHSGKTTRQAGLIALSVFKKRELLDKYYISSELETACLRIICHAAHEIKSELKNIFDKVLNNRWHRHGDPYYALCSHILKNSFFAAYIFEDLPNEVLALAELYWRKVKIRHEDDGCSWHMELDDEYALDHRGVQLDFSGASAYCTPIYSLLYIDFQKTLDFIIRFVNQSIDSYRKSKHGKEDVVSVEVHISDTKKVTQYLSHAIWCTHRGIGSPVIPYLLQSMHMALEKFLLEQVEQMEDRLLEQILISILQRAQSASLSSVVCSIVLAHPDKFWKVALILFKTIEFFHLDLMRSMRETEVKSLCGISFYSNPLYTRERLETCEHGFRKENLEGLFIKYQFVNICGFTEREEQKFLDEIYSIIDYHKSKVSLLRKIERQKREILLTRIDRRNFNPEVKQTPKGLQIHLNPTLTPELRAVTQQAGKKQEEFWRYSDLFFWASWKAEGDAKTSTYPQYDQNPLKALEDVKRMIEDVNNGLSIAPNEVWTPNIVCSVLIRFYAKGLNDDDRKYCKQIIESFIVESFEDGYHFQTDDGWPSCVQAIPSLIGLYPQELDHYIKLLLFALYNQQSYGNMMLYEYAVAAINRLWQTYPDDMLRLVSQFIKTKVLYYKYDRENYRKNRSRFAILQRIDRELPDIDADINNLDVKIVCALHLHDLEVLLSLMSGHSAQPVFRVIAEKIMQIASRLLINEDDRFDPANPSIYKRCANYILTNEDVPIENLFHPFIENLTDSRDGEMFISEFVTAATEIQDRSRFWNIWHMLYTPILSIKEGRYKDKIIEEYLLAGEYQNVRQWYDLKDNLWLYGNIAKDLGDNPIVLYSISKVADTGIIPIDKLMDLILLIIEDYSMLNLGYREQSTILYLERIFRRYIGDNKISIKRNVELKKKLIPILTFMLERGSVHGYLLRESIL